MLDKYWRPKAASHGTLAAAAVPSSLKTETTKAEMPNEGDKMLLVIHPYGGVSLLSEGTGLYEGMQAVEVEVKAVKKVTLSVE